jgi:hypothetical protein
MSRKTSLVLNAFPGDYMGSTNTGINLSMMKGSEEYQWFNIARSTQMEQFKKCWETYLHLFPSLTSRITNVKWLGTLWNTSINLKKYWREEDYYSKD